MPVDLYTFLKQSSKLFVERVTYVTTLSSCIRLVVARIRHRTPNSGSNGDAGHAADTAASVGRSPAERCHQITRRRTAQSRTATKDTRHPKLGNRRPAFSNAPSRLPTRSCCGFGQLAGDGTLQGGQPRPVRLTALFVAVHSGHRARGRPAPPRSARRLSAPSSARPPGRPGPPGSPRPPRAAPAAGRCRPG